MKLFADGSTELPSSIGIETLGGTNTVLITRGTPLPISRSEMFSTSTDNQTSIEVHLLYGDHMRAADNRSLGKAQIVGIPPAPRGLPMYEVTFAVDGAGVFTVTARDRATNTPATVFIQ